MNPILLYELRQSVRDRSVLVATMLYLAAMVALTVAVQLAKVDLSEFMPLFHSASPNQQLVQALFLTYYLFASSVLISFGSVKIVFERINGDLVYTTTLTPGRIVWGKVQLGIIISLLFGSMTLPFLTLAWLGRGVDVLAIFFSFLTAFLLSQIHYASTLAVFSGATSLTVAFARGVPWGIGQLLFLLLALILSATSIQQQEFGEAVPTLVVLTSVLCTIAYLLASAQFAPEAANRMFPVRVGLTILFGITMIGAFALAVAGDITGGTAIPQWLDALIESPFWMLWLLVPYLFLVFICERTEWSNRQRQQIPMSLVGRLMAFPFFSGVANAMVWSAGLVWCGILWLIVVDYCTNRSVSSSSGSLYGLFAFALFLFNYCATSLLICNLLLRKWIDRHWHWVPVCVLIGTIIFVLFAGFWFRMLSNESWQSFWKIPFLPYPWPTWDKDLAYWQYVIGEIWLAVLCVVGLPWVVKAFRKFRRACPDNTHRVE